MTLLILEDEIKTARALRRYLEECDDGIQVLDVLDSVRDAVRWLRGHPSPDLILSDIQLSDGLSFEIFPQVDVTAPVIFCTAFDQYAIDAFKANGIDYLLKPVDAEKLAESLEKYRALKLRFGTTAHAAPLAAESLPQPYKRALLVHFQEKIVPVAVGEIAFACYELGNVWLATFGGKRYVLPQTLDLLETQLPPDVFFRANRQFIVQRKAIATVEHYFSRRMLLKLSVAAPSPIIVSKTRTPQLLRWIEQG